MRAAPDGIFVLCSPVRGDDGLGPPIRMAKSATVARDSGDISIVAPVCARRAEYRFEIVGSSLLCRVGILDVIRVNSADSDDCKALRSVLVEYGDARATSNSRHSLDVLEGGNVWLIEFIVFDPEDATDWNT